MEFMTRASLEGGAKVIQLRDKLSDKGEQLEQANLLKNMCDEYDALFFMNDAADVARASNAHGLHIGQTDLPTEHARSLLSPEQLIGRSNSGLEQSLDLTFRALTTWPWARSTPPRQWASLGATHWDQTRSRESKTPFLFHLSR
jgi:thiamine-phosphate diphosphorylase